jgi:hypothetical protein
MLVAKRVLLLWIGTTTKLPSKVTSIQPGCPVVEVPIVCVVSVVHVAVVKELVVSGKV